MAGGGAGNDSRTVDAKEDIIQTDTTAAVLEDLIETLEDGRKGFEQAADKLEGQAPGPVAERMRALCAQRAEFSTELRGLASMHGYDVAEEGSLGGAMHRGWMSLKDALTGDDAKAVLGAAETGEDHAVSEYEDALQKEIPAEVRTVIQRQAGEVQRAHDEVRNLRDSF